MVSTARAAASGPLSPSRYGYDVGARYTSGANGPNRCLYGIALAVNAIARRSVVTAGSRRSNRPVSEGEIIGGTRPWQRILCVR